MNWQEWSALADDAAYWQDHVEQGLLSAEYVRGHILRLYFKNESKVSAYELDFWPLVVEDNPGGVFEPLQDPKHFRTAHGDYALIWPNPATGEVDEHSVDLAPECVRFFCERYGKVVQSETQRALEFA
jgi:hypothetical protein